MVNTNGILAAGAAGEDLIFPGKLTVANGGIVDLSAITAATNSVSFGGAVVNNGKIDVAATLLKVTELTNDTKGKISIGAGGVRISGIALGSAKFLNGGVIEITADTAADAAIDIIGGTFTNKGTIRISESADAPVAAVLSFTSSKFILEPNSKLDGVLVAGTGTMPDNPNTPPELSLELGAGSFEEFTDTPGTLQGFIKSLPVTADDTNALRGSIIAKNRWEATAGSTAAVFTADDALTGSFVFNFS